MEFITAITAAVLGWRNATLGLREPKVLDIVALG